MHVRSFFSFWFDLTQVRVTFKRCASCASAIATISSISCKDSIMPRVTVPTKSDKTMKAVNVVKVTKNMIDINGSAFD